MGQTVVLLPTSVVSNGKTFSRYIQSESDVPSIQPAGSVGFASNTTPILILGANFYSGQITIAGVIGNAGANGTWYVSGGGNIVSASGTTPIVITCDAPHYLATNMTVSIGGLGIAPWSIGSGAGNGAWAITVLTPTTYSLNGSTGAGAGAVGFSGIAGSYGLGGMLLIGSVGSGAYVSGGIVSRATTSHISNALLIPDS